MSTGLSGLLSNIAIPAPIVLSPQERVILAGGLMSWRNVSCVVLSTEGKIKGALYGYHFVSMLAQTQRERIYDVLWRNLEDVPDIFGSEDIPLIRMSEDYRIVLGEVIAKRFGDAIILSEDERPVGVVSLDKLMEGLSKRMAKIGVRVGEVASPLKVVEEDVTLEELLRFMINHRLRRPVIRLGKFFYGCTERELLRYFFSMEGLESIRDKPESIFAGRARSLLRRHLCRIKNVAGDTDVADAWRLCLKSPTLSLIVDGARIATPWDLVIKPYLAGALPVTPSKTYY